MFYSFKVILILHNNKCHRGCLHSSVDLSAPTILLPQIRVPSTPSTLFSFIVFVQYLSCEKNENKQKEAGFGPFKKINVTIKHWCIQCRKNFCKCFLMGQTRPSFVYFHPFLNTTANLIQNLTITGKSIDCVLGFSAQDCRILGSDESTELCGPLL